MKNKFKKVFVIMTLLIQLGYSGSLFTYKSELEDGIVNLSSYGKKEYDEVVLKHHEDALLSNKAYFQVNVDDNLMVYTAIVAFILLL